MSEFSFSGGKELEAALFDLRSAVSVRVGRFALRKAAEPIRDLAASLAPDDPETGAPDLPNSVAVSSRQRSGRQRKDTRDQPGHVTIYVGPTKDGYPQAIPQEFGRKGDRARPYMRPAWDGEGGLKAMSRIADPLWSAIGRAAKRAKKG